MTAVGDRVRVIAGRHLDKEGEVMLLSPLVEGRQVAIIVTDQRRKLTVLPRDLEKIERRPS